MGQPGRPSKLTFPQIYKDYRKTYPDRIKNIGRWEAHNYSEIRVFQMDGSIIVYNYDTKTITFLPQKWK